MEKKSSHSIVVSRGGRAPTLAPLLRAPMSECDYIKCTMLSEIIHHIIISKYTLECTQLNYRRFSQTVFTLSIAINRAEHVCATVIIKHNYMLMCNHKIAINIMLCLCNSTYRTYISQDQ